MSGPHARILRCLDLREDDIAEAVASRETTRALVAHLAAVSAPDTGVAKVLLVLARMATTACDWVEGDLRVELTAVGSASVLDATTDMGGGMLERALPKATFLAPLSEFTRAIDRVPQMIAPLTARTKTAGRIVLTATAAVRRSTAPPPAFEIAQEALFVRLPAPPRVIPDPDPAQAPALPVVTNASVPPGGSEPPIADVDKAWGD